MPDVDLFFGLEAADDSPDTDFEIRKIKASQIIVLPQVRTEFNESEIEELAKSIKEIGLQEPLTVRSDLQGEGFTLINGERRYRALKLLAGDQFPHTYVECKVQRKAVDTDIVELIQIADNMVRKDLTLSEQARTVKRLSNKGLTLEKIGAAIGKAKAVVSKFLSLADMPEQFKPLFGLTEDYNLLYNFKVLADKYSSSPTIEQFVKQCIDDNEITRASVAELKGTLEGQTIETSSSSEPHGVQDTGEIEKALQASQPSGNYNNDSNDNSEEEASDQDSSHAPVQLNEGHSTSAAKAHDSNKSKKEHGVRKVISFSKRTNKFVFLLDDNREVEVSLSQLKVRV